MTGYATSAAGQAYLDSITLHQLARRLAEIDPEAARILRAIAARLEVLALKSGKPK